MPDVFIDAFGARWQDPPLPRYGAAVLGMNLTNAPLNRPDDPALGDIVARQTRQDAGVRDYVLHTLGAAASSTTPCTNSPRCAPPRRAAPSSSW
ncbi:hypothetical protein [Streptomyces sp. NRRL B-3648]|uniref:hypothetical protein n=1 Tax=Streptomyces sp. NRRL B-3648 TaxID=1519493 RepID=UPI000AAA31D6|nr:hypothetical protein [Streptomyces sp. NRRL B-3648]